MAKKHVEQEEILNPFGDHAEFIKDEAGNTVAVTLDIETYKEVVEALGQLMAMQAAFEMFAEGDEDTEITDEAIEAKLLEKMNK